MKELSIEEKAKRYDEALIRANKMVKDMTNIGGVARVDDIQYLFPELKESEDERIRKVLIGWINLEPSTSFNDTFNGFSKKQILAWLEKQGEHANFRNKIQIGDKVTRNEAGVLVNLSQLERIAKKDEKQGEQKSADKVEPKFNIGDTIYYNSFGEVKSMVVANVVTDNTDNPMYEDENGSAVFEKDLIEQTPVWSEEDDRMLNKCIKAACSNYYQGISSVRDWLKSLKYRVQPKQEWSEDDMKKISWILAALQNSTMRNSSLKKENEDAENWLKSLRPQSTWKPSDEQMHYLSWIANIKLGNSVVEQEVSKHLNELLEQLKKLREESKYVRILL